MSGVSNNNDKSLVAFLGVKDLVVHTMEFLDENSLVNCKKASKYFYICASAVLDKKLIIFFSNCIYKEPVITFAPQFGFPQVRGCQLFIKSLVLPCWTKRSNELILKTFPHLEIKKEDLVDLPKFNQLNAQSLLLRNSMEKAKTNFQQFVDDENLQALHGCFDIYLMNPHSLLKFFSSSSFKACIEIAREKQDKLLEAKAKLAQTLELNLLVTDPKTIVNKEVWPSLYEKAFLSLFEMFVNCFPAKENHATMKYIANMVHQLNIGFPSTSDQNQWIAVIQPFGSCFQTAQQNKEWNVLLAARAFFKNWMFAESNNEILKAINIGLFDRSEAALGVMCNQLASDTTTTAEDKNDHLRKLIVALGEYPIVPLWAFNLPFKLKSIDDIVSCFVRHQEYDNSPLFRCDTTQSLSNLLRLFSEHIQSVWQSDEPKKLEYLKALLSGLRVRGIEHSNLVFDPQFNQSLESIAMNLKVADLEKVKLTYDHPFCTSLKSLLKTPTQEALQLFLKETSESINGNWQIEVGVLNQLIQIVMDTDDYEWWALTEKVKRMMVQKNAALLQAIIDVIHV